jgi:hypothetical protein
LTMALNRPLGMNSMMAANNLDPRKDHTDE